ncbi:MAG: hypothetical protein KIS87_09225 [Phycisphaeraceae bacterium]|nr:hypothetical protein [Phycisphaeraceae bacterium]
MNSPNVVPHSAQPLDTPGPTTRADAFCTTACVSSWLIGSCDATTSPMSRAQASHRCFSCGTPPATVTSWTVASLSQ